MIYEIWNVNKPLTYTYLTSIKNLYLLHLWRWISEPPSNPDIFVRLRRHIWRWIKENGVGGHYGLCPGTAFLFNLLNLFKFGKIMIMIIYYKPKIEMGCTNQTEVRRYSALVLFVIFVKSTRTPQCTTEVWRKTEVYPRFVRRVPFRYIFHMMHFLDLLCFF